VATDQLNERDTRLVAWLQEAYSKEAELEADLATHIGVTQKDSYKKQLQRHLAETHDHKQAVGRRLKALGGAPASTGGPLPGPVGEIAGKTVALVKGQLGMARAAVTEQVETHLRNAQEERREEQVEIAIYRRIETFATEVGDTETAKLATRIIRDEERMAKYLDAEIPRLVKELVRTEVPRDQRATSGSRSRSSGSRSRSSSARSRGGSSSSSRNGSSSSSRSGSSSSSRSGSSSSGRSRSRSASR
jgi:ferritin-like metal-binding protein YciE